MYKAGWQEETRAFNLLYLLLEVNIHFNCFAEAIHCGCCSSQVLVAFSSSFLLLPRFSSAGGESMGCGESTCRLTGSGAPLKGAVSSLVLTYYLSSLPKTSHDSFLQNLLSWECFADLGICLLSSVLLSWHFQLPPSTLKSVLLCQSGALDRGQKFSFTACGSSKFGVLRKEGLHNRFFCILVLFPLTFSVVFLGWWIF